MTSKVIERRLITAAIESTYRTDAAPGAGDAMLVENLQVNPSANVRVIDRPAVTGNLGSEQPAYGGRMVEVTFDVELKGSGTAGTAPRWGRLMQAAGLAENTTVSSVDYTPATSGHKSLTIDVYDDGDIRKIVGARGNPSFNCDAGGRPMASFRFVGHEASYAAGATVTPTFDDTVAPVFIDSAFSFGGYSAVISSLSADLQNTVSVRADPSQPNGFGEVLITNRNPQGSIDPEAVAKATNDFFAALENETLQALTTGVLGSTPGNRLELSGPAVASREITEGDREGVLIYENAISFHPSSGDDELKVEIT